MRLGPLGTWEILIVLLVILLLFGARRLPEVGRGIGQSIREFRKGVRDEPEDDDSASVDDERASKGRTNG